MFDRQQFRESLRKSMLENCRKEAKQSVRDPQYVLPTRNEEMTTIRAKMIEEERALYDAEVSAAGVSHERYPQYIALREKMHQRFGSDWMEWAVSLYKDDGSKIISAAREWKEEMSWPYQDNLEKLQIIERLVHYKAQDRLRGRGSIEKDLNQET